MVEDSPIGARPSALHRIPGATGQTVQSQLDARRYAPSARSTIAVSRSQTVGLLVARRLDHHADQRLGPGGAHEHPAAARERLVLGVDRAS